MRQDFECTPETGGAAIQPHPPEPSASFECTPPPAKVGIKQAHIRALGVIADVAREIIGRVRG